jgi:Ca2+-binding EF-hand superfamily protein
VTAGSLLNEADRNKLQRLFQQLDTDKDGYDKEYFFKHYHLQTIL